MCRNIQAIKPRAYGKSVSWDINKSLVIPEYLTHEDSSADCRVKAIPKTSSLNLHISIDAITS